MSAFFRLEQMAFLNSDLIVLCIDGNNPNSLENSKKWISEIKKSKIPFVLCISKIDLDLKIDQNQTLEFAELYNVLNIYKCSIYKLKTIQNLFDHLIKEIYLGIHKKEISYCKSCFPCL